MDGATLQAKIYAGYASAALRVGLPCDQYRPLTATNPLNSINKMQTLPASFNAADMKYGKPNLYGKPVWYCLVDGTQVQPGDYIVNPSGAIWFIAAMQSLLPIVAIDCNRTISMRRAQQTAAAGLVAYNTDVVSDETVLMTGWPCSILQGTKGEKNETGLPGDVRTPWMIVLLPQVPGVVIRTSDIILDDLGRRYIVSDAELSDLGWRMTAVQAQT